MKYPESGRRGLDIGSGPTESACKNVIGARLKGPGMRWTVRNAVAIGHLRCLYHSDQWHQVESAISA